MAAIVSFFPDIPILPVIGNNDVVYHDQAPTADQKASFYSDLLSMWFEAVPANSAIASDSTFQSTWANGGYYSYSLSDDVIVLSLNGMYPFYENDQDKGIADEML